MTANKPLRQTTIESEQPSDPVFLLHTTNIHVKIMVFPCKQFLYTRYQLPEFKPVIIKRCFFYSVLKFLRMKNRLIFRIFTKKKSKVENSVWIKLPLLFLFPSITLINTFTAIVDLSRFNNSCLKSPTSTLVDLTFLSRALRSFSLNQLRNLSL